MAPLQLIDFQSEILAYERLDAEASPEDSEGGTALTFQMEATYDEDEDAQHLVLTIGYNNEEVPDEVEPYIEHRGQVRVEGWLRWVDEDFAERDDARSLLLTNGLTMLYGIARVRVADLTDTEEGDRLVLPSVSFRPLVEDWLEEMEEQSDKEEPVEK